MKKDRITTTSIREIKHSFKRFLSLLVMSMLGVGVFVGIKMAAPDMTKSLDKYYDDNNTYDIKIISTLGFTDNDIKSIKNIENIKKVYPSNSKDTLITIKNQELVIKIIGINNEINKIQILKGRMPKNNNEIVVEQAMINKESLNLNDKIKIIEDETFKEKELTIVGIVKSPLYITSETGTLNRGNTNIGSGKIDYYAYVNNDNFNINYYTELYITIKNAKEETTNSKKYNELIDNSIESINKIKKIREISRYNEIYNEMNNAILKQQEENQTKFDNALIELNNANKALINAKNTLDNSKIKLDNINNELINNKTKLDNGKIELEKNKKLINNELNKYNISLEDINNVKEYLENIPKDEIINLIPKDIDNYDKIIEFINEIENKNIDEIIKEYITNDEYIDQIIENIPEDIDNYDNIIKALKYYKENNKSIINLISGIITINSKEKELEEGYQKYYEYLEEYNKGLNIYNNSLKSYDNSLNLYNTNLEEYISSKNIFDLKISEAKNKLNEIPEAKWYIYSRLDDSGYSSFIDDGKSVSNLAKIFPTIFFTVAILISLISMSRMVEDDRTTIGTLKSLGFNNKQIRRKYLIYSLTATISGGIIGSLLGFFLLPKFIWNIYKILFDIPVFKYDFNPTNIIVGISIAIICICGTTLITIKKVVKEKPSELMRPKAPSNGKRIFLEKITFVWNRINFSNKITIRNLIRYKKRVIMTAGGILGCTALMLAGFGIRDSITEIPDKQYNNIFKFDEMIYVAEKSNKEELNKILENKHIEKILNTNMVVSMTADKYSINIFIPEKENEMNGMINLKGIKTKQNLVLKDNEIIISDKLAQLTNKKENEILTIKDSNQKEYKFKIAAICENYVGNYIFMNKKTYEENINDYQTNIIYIKLDNLKNEEIISKDLLKSDSIMSIMSVNQTIKNVNNMLKSLNNVVLILIVLSGVLSFVVLYNLSYINISERKREIATLKVLGFTDKEVDDYIIKETIILTIMGIILGLIFGIFLTNIIVNTVEIEAVRFIHKIKPYSYIITSILIMSFTIIVSILIHYSLKKIDMIESLKSVE